MRLNKEAVVHTSLPSAHNTALLVISGHIEVNGQSAPEHSLVLMGGEGEELEIRARDNSVVLLMSGEPIDEPIASYGPFVMNTQAEIYEAIMDYQAGKFGVLD